MKNSPGKCYDRERFFKHFRSNSYETISLSSPRPSSKLAAASVGFRSAECRSGTSVYQADCEAIRMCFFTDIFKKIVEKLIYSIFMEVNLIT